MRKRILILAAVMLVWAGFSGEFTGKCVGVSDGDTISVMRDGAAVKVRLAGIDCPESKQDFGSRAKQFTSGLVFQKEVVVAESGKDRYGRFIGTVSAGGTNVCAELVRAGLAWHYTQYSKDAELARLEIGAREAKAGLWSLPSPVPPWEFRRDASKERARQKKGVQ